MSSLQAPSGTCTWIRGRRRRPTIHRCAKAAASRTAEFYSDDTLIGSIELGVSFSDARLFAGVSHVQPITKVVVSQSGPAGFFLAQLRYALDETAPTTRATLSGTEGATVGIPARFKSRWRPRIRTPPQFVDHVFFHRRRPASGLRRTLHHRRRRGPHRQLLERRPVRQRRGDPDTVRQGRPDVAGRHRDRRPAEPLVPNGKPGLITISGRNADATSGIDPLSTSLTITDPDGQVLAVELLTLNPDGTYSFQLDLRARRSGRDKFVSHYTVAISASELAGHVSTVTTAILVPHDQGQRSGGA